MWSATACDSPPTPAPTRARPNVTVDPNATAPRAMSSFVAAWGSSLGHASGHLSYAEGGVCSPTDAQFPVRRAHTNAMDSGGSRP